MNYVVCWTSIDDSDLWQIHFFLDTKWCGNNEIFTILSSSLLLQ